MNEEKRGRKLFLNFSFLTIGKTLGDVFTFLLFVLFSRVYGQEGIGQYSFAIAFAGFFAVLADFGLHGFSIKEISRYAGDAKDIYGRFIFLRTILSVLSVLLLLLILPFLPFTFENKLIVILIGIYLILYRVVDGTLAVFIAYEDTRDAGILDAIFRGTTALVGCVIILAGGSIFTTVSSLPIVTALQVFIAYKMVVRKYGKPHYHLSILPLIQLAKEAAPYAISAFLFQLRTRIDVVFITFLLGAASAGIYNVAYRIIFLLSFIPHFASLAIFPQTSRLFLNSKEELSRLYGQSISLAILIGLPAAAGIWLAAPEIIEYIFGGEFKDSSLVLRYLAWILLQMFILRILVTFLMSCDLQTEVTRSQWKAVIVNAVGNLLLIPAIGIYGAAIATLISEAFLIMLYVFRLKKVLGFPDIKQRLLISVIGVTSFCALFTSFPGMSLFIVVPGSIIIYTLILSLFKEIRDNEMKVILDVLRKNK